MTFYYQEADGPIQEGSLEMFFQITGAIWTDKIVADGAINDYKVSFGASDCQLMELLLPQYRSFQKRPPNLFIRLGSCQGKHSVHTREKIEKGRVILEYVGKWAPNSKTPSSYRWGPIDALNYRNYSGLIEDGFPNVGAFYLYDIDHIPLRVIFVALEEIAEGEILTTDYGMNHSVKLRYHSEYRLKAMEDFFIKNSLEKIEKKVKKLRIHSPRELGCRHSLELENLVFKIRYLYQTPSALMQLLYKGALGGEEVFQYYDQIDFRYFFLHFPFYPTAREKEIMSYLELLKKAWLIKDILTLKTLALSEKVRQRVFFTAYLQAVVNGEDPEKSVKEAHVWNDAFDALEKQNLHLLELKLQQAQKKRDLIQACLLYANEIHSPLAAWLQTLTDPLLPLRPVG